jgi:hypothetical protein
MRHLRSFVSERVRFPLRLGGAAVVTRAVGLADRAQGATVNRMRFLPSLIGCAFPAFE